MPKKQKSVALEDVNSSNQYDPEPYFALLDLYFGRSKVLVQHHLDSMNQFTDEIIPSVVKGSENIVLEKITKDKIIRHRLTFDDIRVKPPSLNNDEDFLFPLDAIQKSLSYVAKFSAKVTQWRDNVDIGTGKKESVIINEETDIPIGKIHIPVGSKYCPLNVVPNNAKKYCRYDPGGYFIVNGNEKVMLSTEIMKLRSPMVFVQKEQSGVTYYIKIQSRMDTQFVGNIQMFTIKMKKDGSLVVVAPRFKEISVFTLMRALGLENDKDIANSIADLDNDKALVNQLSNSMYLDNALSMSREEAREEALSILLANMRSTKSYSKTNPEIEAQQKREHLMHILTKEILPHVKSDTGVADIDKLHKAYYIGYMINKLLRAYLKETDGSGDITGRDDRDHMGNKRIDLPGMLFGNLYDQFFKKMISDCNKSFRNKAFDDNKPPNIISLLKSNSIDQGISRALSIGDFGGGTKKGISQMLSRTNYVHTLSYLRRIISPSVDSSKIKITGPRHLHNTQWSAFCPLESPEGANIGLIKNLAMLTTITISANDQIPIIKKYLANKVLRLDEINKKKLHKYVKVFINGNWIGVTEMINKIRTELREMRFIGEIHKTVSLVFDYKREFHIYTDGGRMVRPYLTVFDNVLEFNPEMLENITSWDEFMVKFPRVIEYVDKEEEQYMMLAIFPEDIVKARKIMRASLIKNRKDIDKINRTNRYDDNTFVRYSHCEIHPCMLLGVVSSNIPFCNHNQSPRGIFQYNQARQAMGLYISDYRERTDISYILYFPQIPLVASRAAKYTGTQVFPAGENVIVAIASYTGYNQEDSQIMNRSSVEKGMFRAQYLKKYSENITKNPQSSKTGTFMKPDKSKVDNTKDANYEKLNEKGYVDEETVIVDGDAIIGLVNPKQTETDDEKLYDDSSTIYNSLVPGAIDKVIIGFNSDGYKMIKLRVRSERIPANGDKFTSRAGQKGTVGFRPHRADMLFTSYGLVVDIIVNPNAIPKRMTIGQLIECFLAKNCAVKRVYGDGTPFMGVDLKKINDELVAAGYEEWGNDTMYNGMTGRKMPTKIFVGPTYYQRLKQMVSDKAHSRSTGPMQMLTRQPTEGRPKKGGLRFGEMERDAIIAHGAAQTQKERMVDNSDLYYVHVCDICGLIAHKVPQKKHYMCQTCKNTTKISKVAIPYAFKLLLQELRSISILGRIRTARSIIAIKN